MTERLLRVAGIVEESIVDGPGYRFTIFTQGCPHDCPGCHNPQTHPIDGGTEVSVRTLYDRILRNPLLRGVTFSGGEPFLPVSYTHLDVYKRQGLPVLASNHCDRVRRRL